MGSLMEEIAARMAQAIAADIDALFVGDDVTNKIPGIVDAVSWKVVEDDAPALTGPIMEKPNA